MEKKSNSFNLGSRGFIVILLSFMSCYLYSALTSDSLNVTIGVFGEMGLNTNALYSLSAVATLFGILGTIIAGKVASEKTVRLTWAASMFLTGVFALIWSQSSSVVIYGIGYIGCYTLTLACAMFLSFQAIARWFPKKRGVAMGIVTAGFPLSAASTTAICSNVINSVGISAYYIGIAVVAFIVAILIFVFVRDFPEEVGAFPDNDRNFDFAQAEKEHREAMEYVKTSKWTVARCLKTARTWQVWIAVGTGGLLSMGIMSNFVGKYLEGGYELPEIFGMLAIAGALAIPGSIFVGYLDVKLGTKMTGILVNVFAVIAIVFNLTDIRVLHYAALPILALMLGGSSNMLVACCSSIWGRYDFQNAFRVLTPLNSIMTGLGITIVGIIGTNFGFEAAYQVLLVLAIIALVVMCITSVDPIDNEVR